MPRGKPFAKGFDERRHSLSRDERSKGYKNAPSRIRSKIRSLYRGGKIRKFGPGAYLPPEGYAEAV